MKRQIGILIAVWLITSAFLRADTSYLLIQGPFGSGGSELTYKWRVDYPTGYLVTGQDLLDAVFGTPFANGDVQNDPVFDGLPQFNSGNSAVGADYVSFGSADYLALSFTLDSITVDTNDSTSTTSPPPNGASTVGWNYYVDGGGGDYAIYKAGNYSYGAYANTGNWILANDGANTRYLSNGSFDAWVYGNTGLNADGSYATSGSATAVVSDTSSSDNPSNFSTQGANDIFKDANVTTEGKYTLLLSATSKSATVPQASGFATMRVGRKGGVILAGKLPDGQGFTAFGSMVSGSTPSQFVIETALYYPVVANHGSRGFLFGSLTFATRTAVSNLYGTLEWFKPQQRTGAYLAAIDTNLNVIGSIYTPPTAKSSVLPGFTNGTIALSDTSTLILTGTAQLAAGNKLTVTNPTHGLTVKIDPADGIVTGSFVYPGKGPGLTAFRGVLFQDQTIGGGLFLGPNGSGSVSLSP